MNGLWLGATLNMGGGSHQNINLLLIDDKLTRLITVCKPFMYTTLRPVHEPASASARVGSRSILQQGHHLHLGHLPPIMNPVLFWPRQLHLHVVNTNRGREGPGHLITTSIIMM